MDEKKIVILGGGYAGTFAGKLLHKKFKKDDSVSITLIDKKPYHTLMTELHEVAGNRTDEDSVKVDLKKIFAKRKVDVVLDEITGIDFEKQVLSSKDETYNYDYLIIGAGAEPCCFGIDGVKENAFMLWSYEDAVRIKEHIRNMFHLASQERDLEKRKALLTFVVVGAGFTGIEMIGELAEWKRPLSKEYNIDLSEVRLIVMDALGNVLPSFPEKLANKTTRRLNKMGVEVLLNSALSSVTPETFSIGELVIPSQTVIWAAGVQSNEFVSKLGVSVGRRGRAKVNEYMQCVDHSNVYFVGDNSYFEEEGKPVLQVVEAAHQTAENAVHNIWADITGKEKEPFKSNIRGFMVSVGSRYGVANLGAKNPTALSGWIAMFVKHMINVVYLFTISGFNRVWTYAMHEFFHIKDRRSFVGGHFSKASPNFWLVPLRLYLGVMWMIEGLNKLPRILADPNDIFLIPQPVVDGVTAATEWVEGGVAEEAVAQVVALPVPQFIESIVAKSMEMFFYTPDGGFTTLATIFQTGMVIGEIVVGLMLIGGLFTAFGSILSIVMCLMIWSSGMAPMEILWFGFSAIALIGGSGSTFGLDYYVLPWLKKYWNKIGFVRKGYFYID